MDGRRSWRSLRENAVRSNAGTLMNSLQVPMTFSPADRTCIETRRESGTIVLLNSDTKEPFVPGLTGKRSVSISCRDFPPLIEMNDIPTSTGRVRAASSAAPTKSSSVIA